MRYAAGSQAEGKGHNWIGAQADSKVRFPAVQRGRWARAEGEAPPLGTEKGPFSSRYLSLRRAGRLDWLKSNPCLLDGCEGDPLLQGQSHRSLATLAPHPSSRKGLHTTLEVDPRSDRMNCTGLKAWRSRRSLHLGPRFLFLQGFEEVTQQEPQGRPMSGKLRRPVRQGRCVTRDNSLPLSGPQHLLIFPPISVISAPTVWGCRKGEQGLAMGDKSVQRGIFCVAF